MSVGVAVKALDSAGGAQLAGGQSWFQVEGQFVVLLGDPVTPHAPPVFPHTAPVMAEASDWMTIDGAPVCREGNAASCGHLSTGRSWWTLPS